MFIDARSLPNNTTLNADICIIGAGAAGLSLVEGLKASGLSVLLIESGPAQASPADDPLNDGTSNDPTYPFQSARARALGGTTTRWTGACIPLAAEDFTQRNHIPHSGWPITAADLAPYYAAARAHFGLPPLQTSLQTGPFATGALSQQTVHFSTPLNLGQRFKLDLDQNPTIKCLLNGSVTQLRTSTAGTNINSVTVQTGPDTTLTIHAKCTVLAAGGIENARLLLASNTIHSHGIGNHHDVVGRYHMEHPIQSLGILALAHGPTAARPFTNKTKAPPTEQTFGLHHVIRAEHGLMDMHIRLHRYHPVEATPAIIAAKQLERSGNWRGLGNYLAQHGTRLSTTVLPYTLWHLHNKLRVAASFSHVRLRAFVENPPDPDNRITLSTKTDCFGHPLPHLHYRTTAQTRDSITRSMSLMADDLARRGIGHLTHSPDDIAHLSPYDAHGLHHMGSTRMATDPRHGVVDANLCVHGMSNLFITGSSVFTTGGAANPTLTISALSLRLADHLTKIIPDLT